MSRSGAGGSRATIHDVAARAGVSIKTVSRVMNREPHVSEGVRDRVRAAIAALAYVPNPGARRMSNARSFVVGLFYHTRMGGYIDRLQMGASRRCREAGYMLAIEPLDWEEPDIAGRIGAAVRDLHLDGVILAPPVSDDAATLAMLRAGEVPFVRISPRHDPGEDASVSVDDRRAMHDMTRHVLARGHRAIGFIGGPPHLGSSAPRLAGFVDAHREAGVAIRGEWQQNGEGTLSGSQDAADRLLSGERPTAIVTAGDVVALGALLAAGRHGLLVPRDLSLTGFDDIAQASALRPALTTVRQPVEAMGEAAADIVIGHLARPRSGAPIVRLLPTELILRDSVAAMPAAR